MSAYWTTARKSKGKAKGKGTKVRGWNGKGKGYARWFSDEACEGYEEDAEVGSLEKTAPIGFFCELTEVWTENAFSMRKHLDSGFYKEQKEEEVEWDDSLLLKHLEHSEQQIKKAAEKSATRKRQREEEAELKSQEEAARAILAQPNEEDEEAEEWEGEEWEGEEWEEMWEEEVAEEEVEVPKIEEVRNGKQDLNERLAKILRRGSTHNDVTFQTKWVYDKFESTATVVCLEKCGNIVATGEPDYDRRVAEYNAAAACLAKLDSLIEEKGLEAVTSNLHIIEHGLDAPSKGKGKGKYRQFYKSKKKYRQW